MWGSSNTKQLENFDESIVGKPSIFLGGAANVQPYWYTITTNRVQYLRRILITNDVGASVSAMEWDSIFRPREAVDFSLILTYIINSPHAVYLQSDRELPEQFVTALYTKHPPHVIIPVTLIVLLPEGTLPRSTRLFHNIFFPHIADHNSTDAAKYIGFIHSAGLSTTNDDELRAYIKELRIAGGGLVWSRVGQSIYWYDPADCHSPAPTTPAARAAIQKQAVNALHKIASQLESTLI